MPPLTPDIDAALLALPKAELHIHLEGSIAPMTLLALAGRNGIDLGCTDEAGLREKYRFTDFLHFIRLYGELTHVLRSPADFALITADLGRAAAAQGTRYLEVTFSPSTHYHRKGIPFDELLDALVDGAASARQEVGVEMRFIADHVRSFDLDECYRVAEWCLQGRSRGVVALGLAGYEPERPASLFGPAIYWAQARGVPFVPHAGEAVGPEGIWDALQFQPSRIGHGIRSVEDPALVAYLRDQGTVLEISPTSNVYLRNVTSLADHPLRRLYDAGVRVTLNSDDPPMFNTTLLDEYRLAYTHFGFSLAELAGLNQTALAAAFLPAAERARLGALFEHANASLGLAVSSPISLV